MDLYDYLNVWRVLRTMAAEWGCPVWVVKKTVQGCIDRSWESAESAPEKKLLWLRYFPEGKPTPEGYILRLGHAKEAGEEVPELF